MGRIDPRQFVLRSGQTGLMWSASSQDASDLLPLRRSIVEEGNLTLVTSDEFDLTEDKVRDAIQELGDRPGCLMLVAEVDGEVVGMVEFENGSLKQTAHAGQIYNMFVYKSWREKGVGIALLETLLDWAAENPLIEKVGLAVFSTNSAAIGLYKKAGFIEEGRCPRDMKMMDGSYIDSVLMYKFV